jgi:hypothetical protein
MYVIILSVKEDHLRKWLLPGGSFHPFSGAKVEGNVVARHKRAPQTAGLFCVYIR